MGAEVVGQYAKAKESVAARGIEYVSPSVLVVRVNRADYNCDKSVMHFRTPKDYQPGNDLTAELDCLHAIPFLGGLFDLTRHGSKQLGTLTEEMLASNEFAIRDLI